MKRIKYLVIALCMFVSFIMPLPVKAASASISASATSVEVGTAVTIYVNFTAAAWNINVSGSGISEAYASQTDDLLETAKSYTYTLDTSVAGSYTVVLSGDITDENGVTTPANGSVTVTVTEPTPPPPPPGGGDSGNTGDSGNSGDTGNSGNTTPPPPSVVTKSSDAKLSSLTVNKGTLSPKFTSSVTDYTVELTTEDTEITIGAKANHSKAKVSGATTYPISLGDNSFSIKVTAEDGTVKTYTVNVVVSEVPMIYLDYNNEQLGVLTEYDATEVPKGFEPKDGMIDERKVPFFVNQNETLTLVYLMNSQEMKGFYMYDETKGVLGLYRPLIVDGKEVYIIPIPENLQTREAMAFATASIGGEELQVWTFNDQELQGYSLLYVMDENGETGYYLYDENNPKLLLYPDSTPVTYDDFVKAGLIEKEPVNYGLYGGIAAGVIALFILILVLRRKKKPAEEEVEEEEFIIYDEEPEEKTIVVNKEEFQTAINEIETDLVKMRELDQADIEEVELKEEIISVISEVEEEEWLSEDLFKSILNDDED